MTELLIQKETFSIANSLKDIFENRLHNVCVLSEGDENNVEIPTKMDTYICSKEFSEQKGGDQEIVNIAKKFRVNNLIIVEENASCFSINTLLGGNLYKVKLPPILVFKC